MGKNKTVTHPGYEEMQDTPWITQARQIADIGGKGVLENYNKVNVFDEGTQKSLDARNNATYKRAFDNMERAYTDTMNKYNAANYGQFGTLNATPAAYRTDNYQRDFQRQMDDLAYNQATNYDNLMDKELQRRYNTLDMYNTLYNYGQTPYQQDLANWNIRNTNRDISYKNALSSASSGSTLGNLMGALGTATGAFAGSALGTNSLGSLLGGTSSSGSNSLLSGGSSIMGGIV